MENQEKQWRQMNYLQEFEFEKTPVYAGIVTTTEYVALKPVCENLGLDWPSQLKRVKRDEKQNQLWSFAKVIAEDGKPREMVVMRPLDFQNWLYGLNVFNGSKIQLWSSYKQSLVVYLLMMLKGASDELIELRSTKRYFDLFQMKVTTYIDAHNEGKEYTKHAKGRFKDANVLEKEIIDMMKNTNTNQLTLL